MFSNEENCGEERHQDWVVGNQTGSEIKHYVGIQPKSNKPLLSI